MALNQTQVSQLYVALFGRASEGEGNTFWQAEADQATAANAMLATSAASTYFGTSLNSNQAFVEHIYLNTLGKTLAQDPDGIAFWVKALTDGNSRGFVVAELIKSATDAATAGTAQDQFNNRVEVSNYMAATVQTAPADYATSTAFKSAAKPTGALDVTNDDATVTTAKAAVVSLGGGKTFTLTTGTDDVAMTSASDIVNGSVVNSLNAADKVIDSSTTDNDTLNVKISTANVQATIKNVENVNVDWASNNTLAIDATNMTGNTFNLAASGLAFSGSATITKAGMNNVNAGSNITGTLTLTDVVTSKVDAGQAATVAIDEAATMPTVDTKSSVDLTVNKATVTVTNTDVENLTIQSTVASTVTLSNVQTKLTAAGSQNLTIAGQFDSETVVDSMTAGTLTLKQTTAGTLNSTKIGADLINVAAAVTTLTVADNQKFGLVTGGSITTIDDGALTNTTVNLTTAVASAGAGINITGINNLNLEVTKDVATVLTTDADNNIVVTGSGINTMSITGIAAVDASAATGKQVFTATADNAVGYIGSTTAVNTVNLAAVKTANATLVLGGAADEVTMGTVGKVNVNLGAGDDKITLDLAHTNAATVAIDGGTGTDTLVLTDKNALSVTGTGVSKVTLTGIENIKTVTATEMNNVQLSGKTYTISSTSGGNNNFIVNVYDSTGTATASTTDLSSLVFSNDTGANFSTVTINGRDNVVDTIKATKLNDTIHAGTKADIIDISQGGADTISFTNGDSTYTSSANNVDQITGFNMSATATIADKLDFGTASVQANISAIDVKGAITSGAGAESVTATVTNGIMTIAGTDASAINTLAEMQAAAKTVVQASAAVTETAVVDFETLIGATSLAEGESVTVGGLTLTLSAVTEAGTDVVSTITAANVAAAFASLAAGATAGNAATITGVGSASTATFSGTLTGFSSGVVANTDQVTFTSSTAASNVTNIVVADNGATTTTGLTVTGGAAVGAAATGGVAGESVAFLFDGNTYVYNYVNGTAGTDNLVELVGITAAAAVGTSAATDTILIA